MKYLFYLLLFTLPVISGCTPEVPPPPVERNDLVVRFFRSLRNNSTDSAIMQGEKLYVMDKRNYFILKLVSIQQANSYIRQSQSALNSGDLASALRAIDSGIRRFPENGELRKQRDKLQKLRHAERHFIAMRTAPNPTAMNSALAAAQAGLEGIESAKLNEFFDGYQKNIERWNKHSSKGPVSGTSVPIRSFDDK